MAAGDLGLLEAKRALRSAMNARRQALDGPARAGAAAAVAERLATLPEMAAARVVAGYRPIRGELDPGPALDAVAARGGATVYPRMGAGALSAATATLPRLGFHRVSALDELEAGPFGVPEPRPSAPVVPLESIDVFLVPGLAFDARGLRLGYGRGYYDEVVAWVRAAGRGLFVGVGFDFQIVDACPAGAGDQALDAIVTDARILRVMARSEAPDAPGVAKS